MSTDTELVRRKFERIGARAKTREGPWFRLDIDSDRKGDYFDIQVPRDPEVAIEPIDVRPNLRHLLLLVRQFNRKEKFLCGHDERHWFAAAVPGYGVSTVATAFEALKPKEVREEERSRAIRRRDGLRRRNEAFIRQGEWFFVPWPDLHVDRPVLRNEPLSRGDGSKAHMCEEVFRSFGVLVYVSREYPNGLYLDDYRRVLEDDPGAHRMLWSQRRRDAMVWARGRVWHPDHKTVFLDGWHRVYMNTENEAPGRSSLVFLD